VSAVIEHNLRSSDDMSGHPAVAAYVAQGYEAREF